MKELSIEQKAQRYDEALKVLHKYDGTNIMFSQSLKEEMFPEIRESKDERIRKKLISYFSAVKGFSTLENNYGISNEDAVAWLEKQGEQNYKIIKGKNYFCVKTHNYAGVKWIEGTKYYASDNYTLVNQGCEYYCPEYSKEEHNNLFEEVKYDGCVEKQGEQKPQGKSAFEAAKEEKVDNQNCVKPADKVEPKFKVGDIVQYITDSTDRRKIEEVDELCNMYHTDSSPIMFEVEDEWKIIVLSEDVEEERKVNFHQFTFDNILALQRCMEIAKKVQEDKDLYDQLLSLYNKVHDAYTITKK